MFISADRKILSVNPAYERITGFSAAERVGQPAFELIHPDDREEISTAFQILAQEPDAVITRQFRARGKSGPFHWMEGTVQNLLSNPSVQAFVVIVRDVTERKRAEDARRESEEKLRLIADHMTDAIWMVDMGLNLIYVTPSLERARGYTFDELKALPLSQHFSAASLADVMRTLAEELVAESQPNADKNRSRTLELEYLRKDGSTFWGETKLTFIRDSSGVPTAILGSSRDITERKRAEEEINRRLTELEGVNKISTALRAAQTLDEMLPRLLDETLDTLNTNAGAIWLYDATQHDLRRRITRGRRS